MRKTKQLLYCANNITSSVSLLTYRSCSSSDNEVTSCNPAFKSPYLPSPNNAKLTEFKSVVRYLPSNTPS
jgi:hypothetical protein